MHIFEQHLLIYSRHIIFYFSQSKPLLFTILLEGMTINLTFHRTTSAVVRFPSSFNELPTIKINEKNTFILEPLWFPLYSL